MRLSGGAASPWACASPLSCTGTSRFVLFPIPSSQGYFSTKAGTRTPHRYWTTGAVGYGIAAASECRYTLVRVYERNAVPQVMSFFGSISGFALSSVMSCSNSSSVPATMVKRTSMKSPVFPSPSSLPKNIDLSSPSLPSTSSLTSLHGRRGGGVGVVRGAAAS